MLAQLFQELKCYFKGHVWASWYGMDWLCIKCGKTTFHSSEIRPKDRFHSRASIP